MAKRQRSDEETAFFMNNQQRQNPGGAPLPFFPYLQNNTSHSHPFVSNMASCAYAKQVYPTASNMNVHGAPPLQKRMKINVNVNENANANVNANANAQKENEQPQESKIVAVANELANHVVKRDSIDDALRLLEKLELFLASEKNELDRIMRCGPPLASGIDLSDASTLHWMNNFLFLQIGYLSSFEKDTDRSPGSRTDEGPWSKYAKTLMKSTFKILAKLQEYNYQRHFTGRKTSSGHYQGGYAYNTPVPVTVPSFQLSEVEIIECANVLSKVLRRLLDMIQHSVIKGQDLSDCMSTIKNCVDIFCYFQRSMYMCLPALKSNENAVSNLVRVVAEVSGNPKLSKEGGDMLDNITNLFKALSTRSGFDLEQPPSVLAAISSDIIRFCSQPSKASGNCVPSFNVDENYAFFMDFLEKLRFALRSRDDSVQQKWDMLFRSMELMMRTADANTKLIQSILTCIKYFSMSRLIVPFLSNDKLLVSSIAVTVTRSRPIPSNDPRRQGQDQKKNNDLDLAAMGCLTALSSKLISLPKSSFASNGCANVIDVLFTIAGPKTSPKIQSEVVKGLRLFIRSHTKEIHSSLAKLSETETASFFDWIIHIPASKKASRSVKQAAITFVLEIFFSQHFELGSKLYSNVLEAAQELMLCEENECEVHILRILSTKLKQQDKLEDLANNRTFLSTIIDAATNDKHSSILRHNAMLILKTVAEKEEITKKLTEMEEFTKCALKFLSFDGNGQFSRYRRYVIEIIFQVSQFSESKKDLSKHKDLIRALLSFARNMREDCSSHVTGGDSDTKSNDTKDTAISKSSLLSLSEELALMG